ncbi:MAG: efflux RND transporter periplasmic adaptor subunit [Silicimonas sp.]|nr:efflux RND transporter periplasmic adaptor subunit [Silicimonas sp.]
MRALVALLLVFAVPASAESLRLEKTTITEWKSVFATIAPRRLVSARARIGGTVSRLDVTEGDQVAASDPIGLVLDEKLDFQIAAIDAQIEAANAQLANAETELKRGESLVERGVSTAQRLDALRTQVDVATSQIASLRAERDRAELARSEGAVEAPAAGLVLSVPAASGEVVMPGEALAMIGAGGFFLRLQVPERYAAVLSQGDTIMFAAGETERSGRIAKIYPQIEGGRVQADIDVDGLEPRFAGERVAVRLPVGQREALLVPVSAVLHRSSLDFVMIEGAEGVVERVVVRGGIVDTGAEPMVEIVSGLAPGETVLTRDD